MERSGKRERESGGRESCLNEGTEAPRARHRLTKLGDVDTGGSDGHLSPTGKLPLVVYELPNLLPRRGQMPHVGRHKIYTNQGS